MGLFLLIDFQTEKFSYSYFLVVTCTTPDVVDGSKNPTESPIDYDTTVTYSCGTGFQLSGTASLKCQADGTLPGSAPTCESRFSSF